MANETQKFSQIASDIDQMVLKIDTKYLEQLRFYATGATSASAAAKVVGDLTRIYQSAQQMFRVDANDLAVLNNILGKLTYYKVPTELAQYFNPSLTPKV